MDIQFMGLKIEHSKSWKTKTPKIWKTKTVL